MFYLCFISQKDMFNFKKKLGTYQNPVGYSYICEIFIAVWNGQSTLFHLAFSHANGFKQMLNAF